jgi:hypothetical protein
MSDDRPEAPPRPAPPPDTTPRRLPNDDTTLPELPVTLEVIYARQSHTIHAIEELGHSFQNIDKEWATKLAEMREERKHLIEISTRLSETAVKMLTARAILQVVPPAARLVTFFIGATLGAFAGAFTATWMWLSLHPPVVH